MRRRTLIGRALGALAALGAAAIASPATAAAVAVPGRLCRTEWVDYEQAGALRREGWREIERDVTSQRVLMEFDEPFADWPGTIASPPYGSVARLAEARIADMNREVGIFDPSYVRHSQLIGSYRFHPPVVIKSNDSIRFSVENVGPDPLMRYDVGYLES